MLLPICPIDYDIACPGDRIVSDGYRAARVLVRWHGVPLGILQVSVASGVVRASDIGFRVMSQLQTRLGREMARRALAGEGIRGAVDAVDHCPDAPAAGSLPTISVAVCTRDRPDDMEKCLTSLLALRVPPLEIIVVDNAPATDATERLVKEKFPGCRYIREDTPGLDHARNRAISESRGEVIAYTDDDVMVDPDWVEALGKAFAEDPAVGLVTGLIEPAELETEAQLLFERYGGFGRGCFRTYLQSGQGAPMSWNLVGAGQLGAGANMAIRRSLFEEIGYFDPALDVGTPTLGGGDHEIFFRCLRSGAICLYEPMAVVRHRHRRSMPELAKLLYSYGHATRCFFEREAEAFPTDRPAINKLARWWWRHWAWERLRRSLWSPTWFPLELVNREIKGYLDGKGRYRKARQEILPDESKRPDGFKVPEMEKLSRAERTGLAKVDISKPLQSLNRDGGKDVLELLVHWKDKPLGRIRIRCLGKAIVPSRLADEISKALWRQVIAPGAEDPAIAWSRQVARLQDLINPAAPIASTSADPEGVSVIVATCGRPEDLRRCLTSLAASETKRRVQMIVVDNRPDTPGAKEVLRDFPGVELVEERRPGSSYARNAGMAAAREEIVAMTDDDMTVSPRWLEQLVAPFRRNDVAAVTGNTLPASLDSEAELQFEAYGGFGRGYCSREFDEHWFHRWKRRATPTWQLGGTGNLAFRRSLFEDPRVGPFEECLGAGVPAGVGEDTLWFYQILRSGHVIVYEPAAVAWHHHRITMKELRKQLMAYSKGHVAYHLLTLMKYRDKRALVRLGYELPGSVLSRAWRKLRGSSKYPWRLLGVEVTGMLLGPLSLWQSMRHVRKHGPGARPASSPGNSA